MNPIRATNKGLWLRFYVSILSSVGNAFKRFHSSSMWPAIPHPEGKSKLVDLKLEGDVSAAPFGDGCKKGI